MTWQAAHGLEGQGVVVTGAASGIGRAVAQAFAQAGACVAALDLREQNVAEVVATLEGSGPHLALGADLRNIQEHGAWLERARERFGRLDVLAHAAGVIVRRHDIDEVTEEEWDLQHDVNLKATFFLNREMGKVLRRQGRGGRIVNVASIAWWTGSQGAVAYAATKGGVVSLTRGLARVYAPDGITVNAVAPGPTDTPMAHDGLSEAQLASQVAQIPLGYLGAPQDVAGTVVFLASNHGRYITGATISVSGGWVMY